MPELFSFFGQQVTPLYAALRDMEEAATERAELERMWCRYHPLADPNFISAFAVDPHARFWEMWISLKLIDTGRCIVPTRELPGRVADGAPDICIAQGDRRVWIEAVAPGRGEGADAVPELVANPEHERTVRAAPVDQVHLRITSALLDKKRQFERYLARGVVQENDVCLVAIGGGKFGLQAAGNPWPKAVTAVFPIGDEAIVVNRENFEVVDQYYQFNPHIPRVNRPPIDRTAFVGDDYTLVSGLIWSRVSLNNFLTHNRPLSYVHNPRCARQLPYDWGPWNKEFITELEADTWTLSDRLAN